MVGALLTILVQVGKDFQTGTSLHNFYGETLIISVMGAMFYDTEVEWYSMHA